MATEPILPAFSLDIREQLARIDRTQAEVDKWRVEMAKMAAEATRMTAETAKAAAEAEKIRLETRLAPWSAVFTGLGAGAALFAAGAAFAKLIFG